VADAGLDPPLAQGALERARVVAAVCPQLVRVDAAGGERVDERQQVPALVLVAGGEAYRERQPRPLDR
jgi:hypothetical protein